jgi:hypothetical protein
MSAFSAMVTAPTGAEAGGEVVKNGEGVAGPGTGTVTGSFMC